MTIPESLPTVQRSFEPAEWESDQQRLLSEMANDLEKRVGYFRVQSATVHIYEKSAGTVTVKMVAGPK